MELNNILKSIVKNLKMYYIVFISLWIICGGILLFTSFNESKVYEIIYLVYLISSIFFVIVLGSLIFGSFGKTFMLIQNNRKNYIISSLIFATTNALIFALLFLFLKIKTHPDFISLNIGLLVILFLTYILSFYIGSLYGLFIKYNKIVKRLIYGVLFFGFIIFSYFISFESLEISKALIGYDQSIKTIYYVIALGLCDIIFIIICNVYYFKLNILKAYSIE